MLQKEERKRQAMIRDCQGVTRREKDGRREPATMSEGVQRSHNDPEIRHKPSQAHLFWSSPQR